MSTDITADILAEDSVALTGGAYSISLTAGTTETYSGVISGTGTIDVSGVGSTLILTNTSTFTLPTADETEYVTVSYNWTTREQTYEGYSGSGFRGGTYTIHGSNAAAVTIESGATLQLGTGAVTGAVFDEDTVSDRLNLDNILDDGLLKIESSVALGEISGTGNVFVYDTTGDYLWGASTLTGVIVIDNSAALTIGTNDKYASIDDVAAIVASGTLLLDTPIGDTMTITQNIYETHWGNDINIDNGGGVIVLAGVYSYTDSSSVYSPSLSNAADNFTELTGNKGGRGVNIEGGILQLGNGTTTAFFLPGNNATGYLDLRYGGILSFDYATTGPTYDNITIAGGGLSFYSLNSVGIGTVIFKQGDIVVTNAQYYDGTTQIDANAIVQLGDGTKGDTKTTSAGLYQSSAGDGTFLEAGQTTTVASIDGRDGSTSTGASTNNLINNGTLIVDNTGATYFDDMSGTGIFIQAGAGVTTFGAGITYTGVTEITGGTLALGSSGSLADSSEVELLAASTATVYGSQDTSSTEVAVGAAALDVSQAGNQSIQALAGVAGTHVYLGSTTLTVGDSLSTTYAGVIADGGISAATGGGIVKVGLGTLILTGVETFTGATTVDAGTLTIGAGGSIALSDEVDLAVSGATLHFVSGATTTIDNLVGIAGTTVAAGGLSLTVDETASTTYAGTISAQNLIKTGSGTLTLTSAESIATDVIIDAGTLVLTSAATLGGHMLKLYGSTAVADLSATTNLSVESIGGVAGSEILLGDGTLTLTAIHAMTYAGTIADGADGAGSISYGGTRSLTLSGDNTYSGGTTIRSGTLILDKADSAGTGAITFASSSAANLYLVAGTVTATIASLFSNDNLYVGGFTKGDSLTTSYNTKTGVYTLTDQHNHTEALTFSTSLTTTPTLESTTVNSSGYAVLTGKTKAAA